jgi:hypothetical protein
MAGKGGKRAGAGRPKNSTKHKTSATTLTEMCAEFAPKAVANLTKLANGGFERVELVYEPAANLTIKVLARDASGEPIRGPRGGLAMVEERLYPDLGPDALVLVARKVSHAEPDRAANEYLIDRFIGKPRQAVELTGEDGSAIRHAVTIYLPENGRDTSVQKDDGLIE